MPMMNQTYRVKITSLEGAPIIDEYVTSESRDCALDTAAYRLPLGFYGTAEITYNGLAVVVHVRRE